MVGCGRRERYDGLRSGSRQGLRSRLWQEDDKECVGRYHGVDGRRESGRDHCCEGFWGCSTLEGRRFGRKGSADRSRGDDAVLCTSLGSCETRIDGRTGPRFDFECPRFSFDNSTPTAESSRSRTRRERLPRPHPHETSGAETTSSLGPFDRFSLAITCRHPTLFETLGRPARTFFFTVLARDRSERNITPHSRSTRLYRVSCTFKLDFPRTNFEIDLGLQLDDPFPRLFPLLETRPDSHRSILRLYYPDLRFSNPDLTNIFLGSHDSFELERRRHPFERDLASL